MSSTDRSAPPPALRQPPGAAALHAAVQATVRALHYELVDVERGPRGLLRVTIDRVPGQVYPGGEGAAVTVDDCEAVTRQLQYALEVDGIDYERLEVSSPGLDRPLRQRDDFLRHAGAEVALTLAAPLAGRKHFRGVLEAPADAGDDSFGLVFHDGRAEQRLQFRLDELREARLVPVLDFKGRDSGRKARREARQRSRGAAAAAGGEDGGKDR